MQVHIKPLDKSRVHLTVEVPAEIVQNWRQKAIGMIGEEVKIPGFRPGKVSEDVLVQHVGEKVVADQTVDLVIQNTYAAAIKEHNVKVVARPEKVELLTYEPFKYEVTVAVYPEVKLKNYKKIKISKEKIQITEKEVEEIVSDLQKRFAEYNKVERGAEMKDRVMIDFEGKDKDGVVLDGTRSKNHPVTLGENYLLPDFEKEVVGLKSGDEKEFTITFPKDYHAKHLIGKKVTFAVKVHSVEEVKLPEVNEEFIKKVKGTEMKKEDFLEDVRKDVTRFKEEEQDRKRESEVLEKLLTAAEVEVPEALITEELEYMIEDYKTRVERQGVPLETFLEKSGKTVEDLRKEWSKDARDRLAVRMILRAIIEEEKLEVSEEEVQAEIQKSLENYPEASREKVKEMYTPGSQAMEDLKNRLQIRKVMEMFLK